MRTMKFEAAESPGFVVVLGFNVSRLKDLARAEVVLHLSPRIWTFIIIFSTPSGGIAHLMLGRPR